MKPRFDNSLRKIRAASVKLDPFPHVIIPNFFDPDVYLNIQEYWPERKYFPAHNYSQKFKSRVFLPMEPNSFGDMDYINAYFWNYIINFLLGKEFWEPLIQKTEKYIELPTSVSSLGFPHGVLQEDDMGWELPPHIDGPDQTITVFFYLPNNADAQNLGTSLYYTDAMSSDIKPEIPTGYYDFLSYTRKVDVPYVPNQCLIMIRTRKSFHGFEPKAWPAGYTRKSIILGIKAIDTPPI